MTHEVIRPYLNLLNIKDRGNINNKVVKIED